MYESFFGFQRRPFTSAPDPGYFIAIPNVQNTLDELLFRIYGGQGIAVLTGAAGTGKTQVCQTLLAELGESCRGLYLANSNFGTPVSLLQAILYELGRPYVRMAEQELRLELTTAVKAIRPRYEAIALIVDEAHLLSERLLEEIRTITNIAEEGQPLVRVLLSGQPALEETLTSPSLSALNQRIGCQVSLEPLTRDESAAYISGRLALAGSEISGIFTTEAVRLICHLSDGVPRCLNRLCDHCLMLAFASEQQPIGIEIVHAALEELKGLPLHWNEPAESRFALNPTEQRQSDLAGTPVQNKSRTRSGAGPATVVEREPRLPAECQSGVKSAESAGDESGEVASVEFGPAGHRQEDGGPFADTEPAVPDPSVETIEVGAADEGTAGRCPEDDPTGDDSLVETPVLEPAHPTPDRRAADTVEDPVAEVTATEEHLIGLTPAGRPLPEGLSGSDTGTPEIAETLSVTCTPESERRRPAEKAQRDQAQRHKVKGLSSPFVPLSVCPSVPCRGPVSGEQARFEEEPVFDRYALLDAGLTLSDQNKPPVRWPAEKAQRDQAQRHKVKGLSPPSVPRREPNGQLSAEDALTQPRPDVLIDDVLPLLDDLIEPAVESIETFPPLAGPHPTPPESDDHEDPARERTIIDRLGEAQSLIAEPAESRFALNPTERREPDRVRTPGRNKPPLRRADLLTAPQFGAVEESVESGQPTEYDVVQPETVVPTCQPLPSVPAGNDSVDVEENVADAAPPAAGHCSGGDPRHPRRPYSRLFSELRRRTRGREAES